MGKLVSELEATHPDYNLSNYTKYKDMVEGGPGFKKRVRRYLRSRNFEKANSNGVGGGFYEQRVKNVSYINRVGTLLPWLASCTLSSVPKIQARMKYSQADIDVDSDSEDIKAKKKIRRDNLDLANQKRIAYYHSLNFNADGKNGNLLEVSHARLMDIFTFGRGYFSAVFPSKSIDSDDDIPNQDIVQQREAGELDAVIGGLNPIDVIDWEYDDEIGVLKWVKTHCIEWKRSTPMGPVSQECHYWTFISDDRIETYEATRSLAEAKEDVWPDGVEQLANLVESSDLQNGCPVTDLCVPSVYHIMEKLFDTAWELFNREAALSFSLDCQAIAIPVVTTEREPSDVQLVFSELAAIVLKPGDSFKFEQPTGSHFEASFTDVSRLNDALYAQVMAMSAQSSQIPSAGRLSAESKKIDVEMLSMLLSVYANIIKTGLYKNIKTIQKYRGDDDLDISIEGLDRFIVNDVETMLKKIKEIIYMPGSLTAKKHILSNLHEIALPNASIETLSTIRAENNNLSEEQFGNSKGDVVKDSVTVRM